MRTFVLFTALVACGCQTETPEDELEELPECNSETEGISYCINASPECKGSASDAEDKACEKASSHGRECNGINWEVRRVCPDRDCDRCISYYSTAEDDGY